jgi:hypothetical protein
MGCADIARRAEKSAHVPNITFKRIVIVPGDLRVIFYPIWVVRYSYKERVYFATVDGITGNAMSGRAPSNALLRSAMLAGGLATGIMGIALCLWFTGAVAVLDASVQHSHSSNMMRLPLIVDFFVIPVCIALMFTVYHYFCYGSEVTIGDLQGGYDLGSMWKKLSPGYWLGSKGGEKQ